MPRLNPGRILSIVWPLPVALAYLLFFSPSTSPLFVFEGYDSAVFKTIGYGILHGKTPYLDLFDNKGPVLFFINALGLWLANGDSWGIFILQVVCMSLSLLCIYRVACMITTRGRALIATLAALALCIPFMQDGNQCEEWMMYGFSVALYLSLRTNIIPAQETTDSSHKHLWVGAFSIGVIWGLMMFIRPNDAVGCIGGMMVGIGIWHVAKRQFLRLMAVAFLFLAGAAVVAAPILLWFASRGALEDLWYGMIGLNLKYASTGWRSLIDPFKWSMLLVFAAGALSLGRGIDKRMHWILWPAAIFEVMMIGSNGFAHYYLCLLPLIGVTLAAIASALPQRVGILAVGIVLLCPVPPQKKSLFRTLLHKKSLGLIPMAFTPRDRQPTFIQKETTRQLFSVVPEHERDSIWNYNVGCDAGYFHYSLFYQNRLLQMNSTIFDFRYNAHLETTSGREPIEQGARPLWVVVYAGESDFITNDSSFTSDYNLQSECTFYDPGINCPWPDTSHILLYRRKT